MRTPPLLFRLTPTRPLRTDELAVIRGLGASVATAIELERLDADARQERLQRDLERARAGFLTAMTHDLRTPLATIKTATGALLAPKTRLDASEQRELLEDTYAEAARLERLVDKVLELARIRGGADHARPRGDRTDRARAGGDAAARAARRTGDPSSSTSIPTSPPSRSTRCSWSTCSSTCWRTRRCTGGRITRSRSAAARYGDRVRLAVVDHGPGVPAADRERIFDEFARRQAPTDGPGTGLGLAIVKALVAAHDGRVRCEETPGGGATFVVELPLPDERSTR